MITINLPEHNYRVEWNRDKLCNVFPESLFVTAIELDGEVREIPLTHSCITPGILNVLHIILEENRIPDTLPDGLTTAGRYLNIPLLKVIGNTLYADYIKYSSINLINLPDEVKFDLEYAVNHKYHSLFTYLYSKAGRDVINSKYRLLSLAIINKDEYIVRYILRDDIDITSAPIYRDFNIDYNYLVDNIFPITYYALFSTLDIFNRVMECIPETGMIRYNLVFLAGRLRRSDIMNTLIPQVKLRDDDIEPIIIYGDITTVKLVAPQFDLKDHVGSIIHNCVIYNPYPTNKIEDIDYFYSTYPESLKKAQYLVELYPEHKLTYDLYMKALSGNINDYQYKYGDNLIHDLIMLSIQGNHVYNVKKLHETSSCGFDRFDYLDRACYFGNLAIAKYMLDNIAKSYQVRAIISAYWYAESKGHEDVMKLLKSYTE